MSLVRPIFADLPDEVLVEHKFTRVVRRHLPDGTGSVVLKELLGGDGLQRRRHESRILERLAGVEGVPRIAGYQAADNVIALEDCGTKTLAQAYAHRPMELPALLHLGQRLAAILAGVHRRGVVHKEITPDNIILDSTEEPILVDFSLATTAAEERPRFVHQNEIAGTLAYLAPEQTGRTGQALDHRADLYGLGATLYEMATGHPPFEENDPLQLVHDILAQAPRPLVESGLPRLFSDIVLRLLEKEPGRRYQSAEGLVYDLGRTPLGGEMFVLGERDFPLRLTAPSQPIGREKEVNLLQQAFDRAIQGGKRGALITGGSGVGKSTLINELRPIVTERRGCFVVGKFDQYRQDLPSDAVHQAFRALGRLLLAEPEAELANLRVQIRKSLGTNADIMAALLPEFALLLGISPESFSVDDALKGEGRLVQGAVDLLRGIASQARPVVMVVDDLQWAASTPIEFMDAVLMDESLSGVLLVGAYRDGEIGATHPLAAMLPRWERMDAVSVQRLKNLPSHDLRTLVGEVLRLQPTEARDLTEAIAARTNGNPYDTLVLLNGLKRERALTPNDEGWSWDAAAIRRYVGDGDVVGLLSSRIEQLPQEARDLLEMIACLGGEVEVDLLRKASGLSLVELEDRLTPSLEDGLVVAEKSGDDRIRFRHDRVQQAAYDRMPPADRRMLHLRLARRLSEISKFAGVAAEQFLAAAEEVQDCIEKRRAAKLFLEAAANLRLVNYAAAERFLAAGITLIGDFNTESDKKLRTALEIGRHEALYNLGRLAEADDLYEVIEQRCSNNPMALVDAASVQVSSLISHGGPPAAVALGLKVLRRLGVAVPSEEKIGAEVESGLDLVFEWANSDVQGDPSGYEPLSPQERGIARIIDRMMPAAYFCDHQIMTWLAVEALRMWIKHGPSAVLVGPVSHAGIAAITARQNYLVGYRAGRRALEASEARGYEPETSQSRFLFAVIPQSWFDPLEVNARDAQRAREGLFKGGNVIQACHTYYQSTLAVLESAPLLEAFADEVESAIGFTERLGDEHSAGTFLVHRQLVRALRGETASAGGFSGADFSEEAHLASLGGNHNATFNFHVLRALSAALFGDSVALAFHAEAAAPKYPYLIGAYPTAIFRLLHGIYLSQRIRKASEEERPVLLEELDTDRDWMRARAIDAPENFLHLVQLIEAQRAWATGDVVAALDAFEAALGTVAPRRRPWHKALITELAALFHLSTGWAHTGRQLLAEAMRLYEEWGATGKARELKRENPWLASFRGDASPVRSNAVSADSIDLLAILRTSQALSSETGLARLIAQVVEVLGAITGATNVLLVLRDDSAARWMLSPNNRSAAISVEEAGARGILPLSAFRYVERTREPLMVDDVTQDDRFARDPWVTGLECCSLMLVPILNQGIPRAVLVLENRLSRGVFSADRLEAVKLIAGQLAVSLDNAMLYASMERKVAERTEALEQTHRQLLDVSRQAGMAEVATNVLHNVGNVLNSVNISCSVISNTARGMRIGSVAKIAELLKEHSGDLAGFINSQRGQQLPMFFEQLSQHLSDNQSSILDEIQSLSQHIDHINGIVAMQQGYAKVNGVRETVRIEQLVEDALRLNAGSFERHDIDVVREFGDTPPISIEKHKVLQILVNLINNAKDAITAGNTAGEGRMVLRVFVCEEKILVQVKDNGIGIAPDDLPHIFAHGFTKKKDGHGFGLHSGVLAAREMGGDLIARSDGLGKGAAFTLSLPITSPMG